MDQHVASSLMHDVESIAREASAAPAASFSRRNRKLTTADLRHLLRVGKGWDVFSA
jgi:hypothetical protein